MAEKYKEVLVAVANKEITSTVFWVIVLFILVFIIWASCYFYFKEQKNKNPKKYSLPKQIKARRKSIWAAVALSAICFVAGTFLCFNTISVVSDIKKDIKDNSLLTYRGKYYVTDDSHLFQTISYSKWLSVDFVNGDYAWVYMDSFFEWISTEEGRFDGTVVYGKNSLIVVDIDNKDIKP